MANGCRTEILREHCELSNLSHRGYAALSAARGPLQRLARGVRSARTSSAITLDS
jgi:hypothetical protein